MKKLLHILLILLVNIVLDIGILHAAPIYSSSFDTDAEAIFLDVIIEGKTYPFLFDTGATFSVLDKQFESKLGDKLSLEEINRMAGFKLPSNKVTTPSGEVAMPFYKPIPMLLGAVHLDNRYPILTADLQGIWPIIGRPFYGIIGTSFLNQYAWDINFDKGVISATSAYLIPKDNNIDSVMEMRWSSMRIPQIPVQIDTAVVGFDVDTGDVSSGRITSAGVAFMTDRKMISSDMEDLIVTVDGIHKTKSVRIRQLNIGDLPYSDLIVTEAPSNSVGMAFLKRHNLVLDFPNMRMFLSKRVNAVKRDELDKSGLRLVNSGNRIVVYEVKKGWVAEKLDILKNDALTKVNGKRVSGTDLLTVRRLFRGNPGDTFRIEIDRNGENREIVLTLGKDPLP